jgi:hypothetical protein
LHKALLNFPALRLGTIKPEIKTFQHLSGLEPRKIEQLENEKIFKSNVLNFSPVQLVETQKAHLAVQRPSNSDDPNVSSLLNFCWPQKKMWSAFLRSEIRLPPRAMGCPFASCKFRSCALGLITLANNKG